MQESSLDFRPILRELTDAAQRLRRSLRRAIEAVLPPDADFTSRQIAEHVGLDKTSGWRCLRVATIADVAGILGSLPREKGWKKIFDALAAAGCPEPLLTDARDAVEDLSARIAGRGISQATLEVIAAGELDDASQQAAVRRIRQQHFESTMLILGVSVRARLGAMMVAPNAEGTAADVTGVTLYDGLNRHRDGPPWNIHVGLAAFEQESVTDVPSDSSPFLPAWSNPSSFGEELIGGIVDRRWRFDFVGRRSGTDEPIRAAFLETIRGIGPLTTNDPSEVITLAMPHGIPTGTAVFDVLLHRSIKPSAIPYAAMYATIDRVASGAGRVDWPETTRLPLECRTEESALKSLPETVGDLKEIWTAMLAEGAGRLGSRLSDFVVHRTVIPQPPPPSTVVVRWGLPIRT